MRKKGEFLFPYICYYIEKLFYLKTSPNFKESMSHHDFKIEKKKKLHLTEICIHLKLSRLHNVYLDETF